MEPDNRKPPALKRSCRSCGRPILADGWCDRCIVDRGFICEGCEGQSLEMVEEDGQ
jgi:hypothetical protein